MPKMGIGLENGLNCLKVKLKTDFTLVLLAFFAGVVGVR